MFGKEKSALSFVTFFSKEYVLSGITLIDSVLENFMTTLVFVMPLDEISESILKQKYRLVSRVIIMNNDEMLENIRNLVEKGRSFKEAIFTVKPAIIKEAIKFTDVDDLLLYVDADLFFFRELGEYMLGEGDVYLSRHLYREGLESHKKYGEFNAGFVGFRQNTNGIDALDWWIRRCMENCSMEVSDNHFADQKYLEVLPRMFPNVHIIANILINQSMWAISKHNLKFSEIDNLKHLICFHFHGVKSFRRFVYLDIDRYGWMFGFRTIKKAIYLPYVKALERNLEVCKPTLLDQKRFPGKLKTLRNYVRWQSK
jgi:hypothetical protein